MKTHNFKIGDLVKIHKGVSREELEYKYLSADSRWVKSEVVELDNKDEIMPIKILEIEGEERSWWVKPEWLERV